MRGKLWILLTLLLALVGIWFFYQTAAVASRGGEYSPLYSTERHDPYGAAAILDLLSERGTPVSTLTRPTPLTDAGDVTGAVLIQILPSSNHDDLPQFQQQQLKEWVQEGNTLIQFTRGTTYLMQQTQLYAADMPTNVEDVEAAEARGKPDTEVPSEKQNAQWIADPTLAGGAARHPPVPIDVYSPMTLSPEPPKPGTPAARTAPPSTRPAAPSPWKPLALKAHSSDWIAAVRPLGKGRLIVVGSPTPILNQTLESSANLDFVLALIAPPDKLASTPVLFDEWSHGIGHGGTIIGFIRKVGLLPVLLQLFFVVAMYVWATTGYDPPQYSPAKRRRSATEQIETLGYLYSRSMKPALVFEKVHAEVRRRLAAILRCSPAAIESTLGHVPQPMANKARIILAHLQNVGRGHGPTCPSCDYDLTRNSTGRCPECGAEIHWALRERIAQTDALADIPEQQKSPARKIEARLAAVLRESHQFSEEFARVRNHR